MKVSILIVLFCFLCFYTESFSQFDLLEKVKQKAEEEVEKAIEGEENEENSDQEENKESAELEESSEESEQEQVKPAKQDELKSYSKFDFVPGDKVIYFTDYSYVEVGDFPVDWNTNGSAEVVTLNNFPGKWFKFGPNAFYTLALPQNLPENFTLEFDLVQKYQPGFVGYWGMQIFENTGEEFQTYVPGNGGVGLTFQSDYISYYNWLDQNYANMDNHSPASVLEKKLNNIIHFSMNRQKERMRFYADDAKIIDVQKMYNNTLKFNMIRFVSDIATDPPQDVYITNIRIAAGSPDVRNRLITEGKLVTRGITFDSGSDKIKPESYGTLKEIAAVLKDNSGVRVKIIGHTDSDGEDDKNLELSKKRSAAVKNALSGEFGIDASRLETDGKGEKEPTDSNDTKEGKANNRRVEFIKL